MRNVYKFGFRTFGKWLYHEMICTEEELAHFLVHVLQCGYDKVSVQLVERNVEDDR